MSVFPLSNSFKKYFQNTGWLFFEKVIKLSISLAVGVYVARYLGPENFGILSYSLVFVTLLRPIWMLGLPTVANKQFVLSPENNGSTFGTALVIQGVTLSVTIVIFLSYLYLHSTLPNVEKVILTILIFAQFFILTDIFDQYFYANVSSKYVTYSSSISIIVSSILKLVGIWLSFELTYFALVVLAESAIKANVIIYCFRIYTKNSKFGWRFDFAYLKFLMSEAWPFIVTGTMTGLYLKVDQLMVKNMIGNIAAGQYAVAVKLSEVWFAVPVILTRSLLPTILKTKDKSEELFTTRMIGFYSLVISLAVPIILIMSIYSEFIVLLLFGNDYKTSASILTLYVWSIVFIFINNAQWSWYIAHDYQRLALYRIATGLVLNVLLNIYFIDLYGVNGAVYSTIITYLYVGYLSNYLSRSLRPNFHMITKAFLNPIYGIKLVFNGKN